MQKIKRGVVIGSIGLLGWATQVLGGIVDLTISVQATNLALSWPSTGTENYLIQYRSALDTNTTWTTLTNNLPAAVGTNRTTFLILGVVPPPPPPGTNSGGGGLLPPGFNAARMAAPYESDGTETPLDDSTVLFLAKRKVFPPYLWDREHRPPLPWELEVRPPYPWEGSLWNAAHAERLARLGLAPLEAATMQSSESNPETQTGFFRVFHVPDFAFNVTNYTYDGPTFFPVDFADYVDRVDNCEALLNGAATPYADFMPYASGGQTNWGMGIYFDRLASGTYQIQLRCSVRLNDAAGDDAAYMVLSNRTASIVVANQVTFTNWNEDIQGDTYTFHAATANTNTDWEIEIRDAWNNYVNSSSGHTSNGQIAWTWNLCDAWGDLRDDLDYDPFLVSYITFNTAGSGALAASSTTRQQPMALAYPNTAEWMISFQDRWFSDAPAYPANAQDQYLDGIGGVLGGPTLMGNWPHWFPLPFGTNVYTQAQRNAAWANLKDWLGDPHVRNWYYYGHGGPNEIGCDRHTFDTNGAVAGSALTSTQSRSRFVSWEVWRVTRGIRYRFVFLDGCDTALGNWPATFNISKQTNNLAFYQNHPKHPRPSAFVGWGTEPGGEGWGTIEHYWQFRSAWMGYWANSFPAMSLTDALVNGNRYTPWIDEDLFGKSIRVYGYTVLKIEDYNHKNDWRYP